MTRAWHLQAVSVPSNMDLYLPRQKELTTLLCRYETPFHLTEPAALAQCMH